ncbi:hypothetical protein [Hydrogenophaga sp.]|uniref:hypothetical protein n=1 Tax=Hydrogenophaga sp. TaxID=1904254 RepID=UPI003D13F1B0
MNDSIETSEGMARPWTRPVVSEGTESAQRVLNTAGLEEQLGAAFRAVMHALHRLQQDPRLAYLAGPGSQLWDLLTEASALKAGADVQQHRAELANGLAVQPVPRIGVVSRALCAYGERCLSIDPVLYAAMEAFNSDVHDMELSDGLSQVVNHFLNLGVNAAEQLRDARTEELF